MWLAAHTTLRVAIHTVSSHHILRFGHADLCESGLFTPVVHTIASSH